MESDTTQELFVYNLVRRDKKGKGNIYMMVSEKIKRGKGVFGVYGIGIEYSKTGWREFVLTEGEDRKFHTEDFSTGVVTAIKDRGGKIIKVIES